jgi:solute carrier family 25 (mitochondrial folate transporter), member 32
VASPTPSSIASGALDPHTMPSPSSTPANTIRQTMTPNGKNAVAGACAGILTSLVTCPLDVVKTRLQAQISSLEVVRGGLGVPTGELYKGITSSLRRIWTEEGVRGLYRGLGPVMVGYLPTWYVPIGSWLADNRAVYFPVYEHCKVIYAAPGMSSCVCWFCDEYSR